MIRQDKEVQNEGETMALACGIYESSNTNDMCFYAPMPQVCSTDGLKCC